MGIRASSSDLRTDGGEGALDGVRGETAIAGWMPWLALTVALSPALAELAGHLWARPWARYVVVLALLLGLAALPERAPAARRPVLGGILLGIAMAIQLLAAATGPPGLGRLAIPIGILGLACRQGRPSLPLALLTLFLVPVPYTLVTIFSPHLESALMGLAAAGAQALDVGIAVEGKVLVGAPRAFWLRPPHGGLPLVFLLAAAYAIRAVSCRRGPSGVMAGLATGAALAVPVQLLAVWVAVLIAASGRPEAAWAWLDHGLLPVVAAALTLQALRRRPAVRGTR